MKTIDAVIENRVGLLKLKRKESANALSMLMLEELNIQLDQWEENDNVRAIIITGDGNNVFCAGADLKERGGMTEQQVKEAVKKIRHTINKIEHIPIPVIAAINGAAIGGGLELVLACDLRISSDNATFALTETSLGIIPGAGGTQRLPRAIGMQRAKEMIFTGEKILANTALQWGLVLKVAPAAELLTTAENLAHKICRNGPIAMKQAKYAMNQGAEMELNTALKLEENAYEVVIPTKDRLEGLASFKEKRNPHFTGE
ncbi:enoyl-CoA hydratase-related protein [Evansella sp. AB-P1]|uniref:enoyl-CoA hydratase-related protein n=1 Tax=Evansella sp. AB-P1 TaxID=3037653 RepID=UPI00241C15C9|nr:enoyl-CoA hydratase-related protein [Evansella sp. AB-P1]MDG5786374.1 enoyl-CoA hydratase-related protein [Evansella sp. AB-P1]